MIAEMSNKELRAVAPSIFAKEPWDGVSKRYGFIPTIQLVDALRDNGYVPVRAGQSKVRVDSKREFTKHMVRFRTREDNAVLAKTKSAEGMPELVEVVISNSHDRSSAFHIEAGMFRVICTNGLIASSGSLGSITVRHAQSLVPEAIVAAQRIINQTPALRDLVNGWAKIKLNDAQRRTFAEAALIQHYGTDEHGNLIAPVEPEALLVPRRAGDKGSDLWRTFNVVQENMMRGDIVGRSASGRRVRTRAVQSVNNELTLNRNLWALAEAMAEQAV